MNFYYDTSALCRNYHSETGSDQVAALLATAGSRHVISRVTHLEVQSAFAIKVRTQEITAADFDLLRRKFLTDIHQRKLTVVRLLRRHFDRAEALIVKHGLTGPLRTMDAMHLTIAKDLCEMGIVDTFVCADKALLRFAALEGLQTIDPSVP